MTSPHGVRPNYVMVWRWLVGLMVASLVASFFPRGHVLAVILIFGVAVAKAVLVALNYMHLRFESRLIYAIALIPVIFILGLILALFPDFVFRR